MSVSKETANYPHIVSPDENWREIHLYGIAGTITAERDLARWSRRVDMCRDVTGTLSGQIKHDPQSHLFIGYGFVDGKVATMEGEMTDKKLDLLAIECDIRDPRLENEDFDFHFKRSGQLWVGGEHIELGDFRKEILPAKVATTLLHDNAFGILLGDFLKKKMWRNGWQEPRWIDVPLLAPEQ